MRKHHYNNPNYNKKCCINCIHCYDENSITACIIKDWMKVEWEDGEACDNFDDGCIKG